MTRRRDTVENGGLGGRRVGGRGEAAMQLGSGKKKREGAETGLAVSGCLCFSEQAVTTRWMDLSLE